MGPKTQELKVGHQLGMRKSWQAGAARHQAGLSTLAVIFIIIITVIIVFTSVIIAVMVIKSHINVAEVVASGVAVI